MHALHAHRLICSLPLRCAAPLLGFVASLLGLCLPAVAVGQDDQAQLLLSDRCNLCHGPDAGSREADLRLDTAEGVFAESGSGEHDYIVVPGKLEESELMRRILTDDPSEKMPPPESNLQLSADEIETLRTWIADGAKWQTHWSFRPIQSPPIPPLPELAEAADSTPRRSRNPVDRFIAARLPQQGLTPTAPADRATLLRRLSYDLTGLPPSPEEVAAFLADDSPLAYQRQVDRLLASPRLGERLAVPWMDAARYADTYGYQSDVYREMWPWRDWVIDAFNASMPYDEFLVQQIAGDLIESPTRDSILATAFNRHHRQTNEGGSIEEEFHIEYVADRVNTLGTAVLGLTLECSRCHDHKYDPVSQQDYYQFFAFFNNIDEFGLYSHFTNAVPTPTLWLPTEQQTQQLDAAKAALQTALEQQRRVRQESHTRFETWLDDKHAEVADETLNTDLLADYRFDAADKNVIANQVEGGKPGTLATGAKLSDSDRQTGSPNAAGKHLSLTGEDSFKTPVGGDLSRDDPFTVAAWLKVDHRHERAVVWHRSRAWTDAGSRGIELLIEEGRLSAAVIHFWPGNAIRVVADDPLPVDRWAHVTVRYDGSSMAAGLQIFVDGTAVATTTIRDCLDRTANGGGVNEIAVGARFRDRGLAGGEVDELRIYGRDLSELEISALLDARRVSTTMAAAKDGDDAARAALWQLYCSAIDPECRQAAEQVQAARKKRSGIVDKIREVMVMEEMPEVRETFLLTRGAYDAPAERVEPTTPAFLPPMQDDWPQNRLGLAKWLVDRRNPLTARVAANRIWASLMGRGLVSTAEDFGRQGELPSHPQLLDWMAAQLHDYQWDVKRLMRTILLSHTYQQSSVADPESREIDPENRWYARGAARRLSVEMIRDGGLHAAGLLDNRIGGPPVKPYQPEGLWKEKSGAAYKRDVGVGSHRRSMYTIWKRTSPPPSMLIFDAPDREICVAKRQLTQTPLQALVLLNDEQAVESARGCAARALRDFDPQAADRDRAIVDRLCLLLLGRSADAREGEILHDVLQQQRAEFAANEAAAKEFLAVGDYQSSDGFEPIEFAAVTTLAQAIMNYAPCVRQN
ncbi:Planctomycete cytochrome C [Roseimaritima ulvae]|uniref:Planctomycete cytochrome C n=2 Tax=Roseimaritima ulvae TaxID=980254 RepID=A0A5B9QVW5_9BACT|nr:Planctomycete cytochrome C [Roseimaritima ulvae]